MKHTSGYKYIFKKDEDAGFWKFFRIEKCTGKEVQIGWIAPSPLGKGYLTNHDVILDNLTSAKRFLRSFV